MTTRRLRGAYLYTLLIYSSFWRGLTALSILCGLGNARAYDSRMGRRAVPTPFLCTKENIITNKTRMIHIGSAHVFLFQISCFQSVNKSTHIIKTHAKFATLLQNYYPHASILLIGIFLYFCNILLMHSKNKYNNTKITRI